MLPEIIIALLAYFQPRFQFCHSYLEWLLYPLLPSCPLEVPSIFIPARLILQQ